MRAEDVLAIVAIDDDARDLAMMQRYCDKADHPKCKLARFTALEPAYAAITASPPHLIILDDRIDGELMAGKAISRLRGQGYGGGIAVLSGIKRPGRSQELVRGGAFYHVDKDSLTFRAFMELVDMAMATSGLLRARRAGA